MIFFQISDSNELNEPHVRHNDLLDVFYIEMFIKNTNLNVTNWKRVQFVFNVFFFEPEAQMSFD